MNFHPYGIQKMYIQKFSRETSRSDGASVGASQVKFQISPNSSYHQEAAVRSGRWVLYRSTTVVRKDLMSHCSNCSSLLTPLSQGWKKPGFFLKNPAQWVFLGFFGFFWVFLGFFGFFGVFLPRREGF
jgi:hypothetical protein